MAEQESAGKTVNDKKKETGQVPDVKRNFDCLSLSDVFCRSCRNDLPSCRYRPEWEEEVTRYNQPTKKEAKPKENAHFLC